MKRVLIILLTFILLSTTIAFAASVNGNYQGFPIVNVTINDAKLASTVPAVVLNGSTVLPTRAVAEALNCYVKWDQPTMTAKIIKPTVNMIFFGELNKESDSIWNLENVGCSYDAIGMDKFANFYIEVGPMDGNDYDCRIVAYDPSGNILKTSDVSTYSFDKEGVSLTAVIEGLNYSTPGTYTFKFQMKLDGEFRSLGETKAVVE